MQAFRSGSNNTVIGYGSVSGSGVSGSNNTIIGSNVVLTDGVHNNRIIIADGQGNQRIAVSGSSVGIGTGANNISPVNILQLDSTTQVFTPPRMTQAQREAISSPTIGGMVYQTDTGIAAEGVYVYSSTGWKRLNWI